MSVTISAVWKGMSLEDHDGQPYFGDGGAAWGAWLSSVYASKWLMLRIRWGGRSAILTYTCDDMLDSEIRWVSPKELVRSAERMKDYVTRQKFGTRKLIELHARHAPGAKIPEAEFIDELDDLIRIAEFVDSVGGQSMTLEVAF